MDRMLPEAFIESFLLGHFYIENETQLHNLLIGIYRSESFSHTRIEYEIDTETFPMLVIHENHRIRFVQAEVWQKDLGEQWRAIDRKLCAFHQVSKNHKNLITYGAQTQSPNLGTSCNSLLPTTSNT